MDMINLTISLCDEQLLYYIASQSSQKEVFLMEEDPFNSALGSLKFKSTTTHRDKLDSLLPLQGINSQMSPVKRRSPSFKSGGKQNVKPIQAKAHKLEASPKANGVQNCLSAGSVNPEFGKMPDGRLICPLCSKFFDSMKHARRHFDTIHMKIELKCEICGSSFNRKDNLKSHLMKKHGMESDTSKFLSDKAAQKSF
ncbi:uncharacterized protein LOC142337761 [Convolutriloba macropyga]|uniref:uncharacterized protein LOC142337761 n=1 Tax=Convolutriloba macropyga TaxID=536237 RepID=UPI003F5209DA